MEKPDKVIHSFHRSSRRLDTGLGLAIKLNIFNVLCYFSTEISETITTSF